MKDRTTPRSFGSGTKDEKRVSLGIVLPYLLMEIEEIIHNENITICSGMS